MLLGALHTARYVRVCNGGAVCSAYELKDTLISECFNESTFLIKPKRYNSFLAQTYAVQCAYTQTHLWRFVVNADDTTRARQTSVPVTAECVSPASP